MGLITWVMIAVVVLVAIGLGVGVFFSGLLRGAEIVGQNPTIQNATKETQEFVEDKVDTQISSNDVLVVTTTKLTYNQGEPVAITVKNIGDKSLHFPDSAFGLEIKNKDNGATYKVIAAQVITELGPDQSQVITWQDDSAPRGDYTATVRALPSDAGIEAQTDFEITG